MSTAGADLQACDELRGRLKWLLLGRVSVISGFLAMVAVASLRAGRDSFDLPLDQPARARTDRRADPWRRARRWRARVSMADGLADSPHAPP